MIEVTIRYAQDYRLLSDLNKLTPKIPLRTELAAHTIDGVQALFATYRINGLSSEDKMYIILKYNGKAVHD